MADNGDEPLPMRHKPTEREKLQAFLTSKPDSEQSHSDEPWEPIPITQIERNGELLLVFPDGGDRHARRIQRAVLSGCDRLFWITVTIACGTPGFVPGVHHKELEIFAKQYGRLEKARNDLDAFYQYYMPMVIGDPYFIGVKPGLGKSPGFFIYPIHLDNPTVQQLQDSLRQVSEWIEVNQEDPEYTSFQLNFCFSGHGSLDESGCAGIVLADKNLAAGDLVSFLLSSIPEHEVFPARCRLDLFLDCCHSSAIARTIHRKLVEMQQGSNPSSRSVLNIGQVYCACLDEEDSFELAALPHGVFTFAFLNECSRKQPAGADVVNLGLRDVGWYTKGQQHPLLLDFTVPEGWAMKFPSQYFLNYPPDSDGGRQPVTFPDVDLSRLGTDPVGESVRLARELKAECADLEQQLWLHSDLRKPFSREELLKNKRFPFL